MAPLPKSESGRGHVCPLSPGQGPDMTGAMTRVLLFAIPTYVSFTVRHLPICCICVCGISNCLCMLFLYTVSVCNLVLVYLVTVLWRSACCLSTVCVCVMGLFCVHCVALLASVCIPCHSLFSVFVSCTRCGVTLCLCCVRCASVSVLCLCCVSVFADRAASAGRCALILRESRLGRRGLCVRCASACLRLPAVSVPAVGLRPLCVEPCFLTK